jgi:hypothetical protein
MLDVKERTGKDLHELSIYELINEYKKSNEEISNIVRNAIQFKLDDDQRAMLNDKCKEYKQYGYELAEELMKRMSK